MKKYCIIYHKEDNDGLFSAAIIFNYLIHELEITNEDIDCVGADYGYMGNLYPLDITSKYENVIMTDISFNDYKKMIMLNDTVVGQFSWIDHHAPVINDSQKYNFDNIKGLRDISRSAILISYRYLYDVLNEKYDSRTEPEIFRILSAWDSFSYEREGYTIDYVRNINVGTNAIYKLELKDIIDFVYNIIYKYTTEDINKEIAYLDKIGKIINDAKDAEYKTMISMNGDYTWTVNGRKSCALFTQGPSSSLMFKSVPNDVVNGIVFKRLSDGRWTISLYNTSTKYDKEFDCGAYMKKKYNGGGHKGASGCQVTQDKFIKILKSKNI